MYASAFYNKCLDSITTLETIVPYNRASGKSQRIIFSPKHFLKNVSERVGALSLLLSSVLWSYLQRKSTSCLKAKQEAIPSDPV